MEINLNNNISPFEIVIPITEFDKSDASSDTFQSKFAESIKIAGAFEYKNDGKSFENMGMQINQIGSYYYDRLLLIIAEKMSGSITAYLKTLFGVELEINPWIIIFSIMNDPFDENLLKTEILKNYSKFGYHPGIFNTSLEINENFHKIWDGKIADILASTDKSVESEKITIKFIYFNKKFIFDFILTNDFSY